MSTWRTGRKVGHHLYEQRGPEPSDDDPPIGTMFTPELAAEAVRGHNASSSPGAGLIADERSRQVNVEGYTREHDARHGSRNLTLAATAYAFGHRGYWPWEQEAFKRSGRVRDLVKAGALIAAAIDVELGA